MPIIKQQILKGDYDEVRTVEVIPSGMTLTVRATLKNPNYDLSTEQTLDFTAKLGDIRIYLINDPVDPLEIVYDGATPTGELVMDICSFTLTGTETTLETVDITALEVV
jgi:hypothetical protein